MVGSVVSISPSWGGGKNIAHGMFKMRCKFKFETHFLCMDSLKSVARGKRGTHDTLQAQ